ncbi:universal stress protein [Deinococcus pimensis]|uniref:universal stress protein n=1 Tax=Deinococcus pimensis TaxID=309888 RepID=UPI000480762D|nr:universal stress protein [Deinococcus pimensis]
MFRHILALVDGSPASLGGARHAFELSRALGGRVTLLYLLEHDTPEERERARATLASWAEGARRPPRLALLPLTGALPDTVAGFAREGGVDLVVVGVREGTGLERAVMGALADDIARVGGVPVQVAPPASTAREGGPREAWLRASGLGRRVGS